MKNKIYFLIATFLFSFSLPLHAQIITTIAGDSTAGYCCDDSLAINAELNKPTDVAVDGSGNVYIADGANNRIRKINSSGIITTIAGTGVGGYNSDGIAATLAEINFPSALALDASGNIYFCDDHNYRIRMINTSGIITTIAGTGTSGYNGDNISATLAQITASAGIALDGNGYIYISDNGNNRIRKISSITGGTITTIAGTGIAGYSGDGEPATAAELGGPTGLAIDGIGNMYIAEFIGKCIRKINVTGIISTIAGTGSTGFSGDNGPATLAELNWPNGVKIDGANNVYIADVDDNRIRKVDNSGFITTIVGTGYGSFNGDGEPAISANINGPVGIALDGAGGLYIADWGNNRIRYIMSTVFVSKINSVMDDIAVYPNPSDGHFKINISTYLDEEVQIVVTNSLRDIIGKITVTTNNILDIKLNIPPGIYFLTAITTNGYESKKIVINNYL